MKIGPLTIPNKVVLAPLAGYTNRVYRTMMKEMGAGLVFSEMISAKGILYENDKTIELMADDPAEHPLAIQLFGGEIADMVEAARYVDEKTHADIIDINMGCPVRKVLKSGSGSALIQDIFYAEEMVRAIVQAVKKPVSVKIRAGWDHRHIVAGKLALALERAGASLLTIHGRTKSDLYGGKVNLDWIKEVKDAVKIPVIGNGDIKSLEDALHMIEVTGVDAVMIGRGSLGNPWLIQEIAAYYNNTPFSPPTRKEKLDKLLEHFNRLLTIKSEMQTILEMRSLAGWYVKGMEQGKAFKQKLVQVKTKEEWLALYQTLLE